MLVDSHCHLDFPDFGDDIEGVLARAAEAGVGTLQTICTRVTQFDAVRGWPRTTSGSGARSGSIRTTWQRSRR